jgi:hypothetical protein
MADPYGQYSGDRPRTTLTDPHYRQMKGRVSAPGYHPGGGGHFDASGYMENLLSHRTPGLGLLAGGIEAAGDLASTVLGHVYGHQPHSQPEEGEEEAQRPPGKDFNDAPAEHITGSWGGRAVKEGGGWGAPAGSGWGAPAGATLGEEI